MKYVSILNFSGRNAGNCQAISDLIKQYHAPFANICAQVCNPRLEPCNNCKYECLQDNKTCIRKKETDTIMDQLMHSDIIYFIVPNYCGFPCANYFAFNERTVGYFNKNEQLLQKYYNIKKKFIIVSNTENEVFYKAMEQQSESPEILYISSNKYGVSSIAGNSMKAKAAKDALQAFIAPIVDL